MSTGLDMRDGERDFEARLTPRTSIAGGPQPTPRTSNAGEAGRQFEDTLFASKSVARHYVRGALGLAFVLVAIALSAAYGPVSLLLALPALVLWRGCPTCWTVGLMQTKQVCEIRR